MTPRKPFSLDVAVGSYEHSADIDSAILCVASETQFFGMLNKQCFTTAFSQLSGVLGVQIITMDLMKVQLANSTLRN